MSALVLLLGAFVFAADVPTWVRLAAVAVFLLLTLRPRG